MYLPEYRDQLDVTPYVGVWIETHYCDPNIEDLKVTPYVGVWIETTLHPLLLSISASLLMWECGLKPKYQLQILRQSLSLLMWECGLKHRLST